ncbi:hypothetical protein AURDEDRAFT_111977 [Auricularia subglabra TFB-10046 SS5]|nr:hypothetical protein AURDEDRAFT_111977 [Auricularia subglabra TFB-10046 SS5]
MNGTHASHLGLEGLPASHTTAGTSLLSVSAPIEGAPNLEGRDVVQQLEILQKLLEKERHVKQGAENMLDAGPNDALRVKVEDALTAASRKITAISKRIEELREQSAPSRTLRKMRSAQNLTAAGSPAQGGPRLHSTSIHSKHSREDLANQEDYHSAKTLADSLTSTLVSYARSSSQSTAVSPFTASTSSLNASASSMADGTLDQARVETMDQLVQALRSNVRVAYELDLDELLPAIVPCLADSALKEARASAYRLLSHLVISGDVTARLREHGIDYYLVRSLARDSKHAVEKEHAIRLIRTICEVGRGGSNTSAARRVPSDAVTRALVSIAEHTEDAFRLAAIETLAEVMMLDIDLVFRTGGMRVLLSVLAEGPEEFASVLVTTFLYIIDMPATRGYFNPGTDLEIALSGITDAYGKGDAHLERMQACAKVVAAMLRTWSGLIYLCMNDMQAIRSLVDTLRIPSLTTRDVVLDLFFELLHIKLPEWHAAFINGRRLTMYGRQKPLANQPQDPDVTSRTDKLSLVDQYIALLLLVFTEAGLIEALVTILEESTAGSKVARKATLLIGEILQLANRILPMSMAARIQTLSRVFTLATDYIDGHSRIVGTTALSSIDSFNRNRARLQPSSVGGSRQRANSVDEPVRRGQRTVDSVKIKMGMQIDDRGFQALLLETQVLTAREHTKWNHEALVELIEGPMLNPKRLEESIKVSRFGKRLMQFFHPQTRKGFADMKRIKSNQKWVKLGCTLITTLLSNADGIRFLQHDDPFLKQLVDSLVSFDLARPSSQDSVFSPTRIDDTLAYGYFEMLGTMSRYPEGIELLERFKFFTAFYHLTELPNREDLVKLVVENIDYSQDGHPRILLSRALTSSDKRVREYATRHLGRLIQNSARATPWMLRLLLTQLYDPEPEVCELAVHYLRDACNDRDVLQLVVELQPTLDHLGEIGHPLLLKFMSTPVGFQYLNNADYINREMDGWFHERNKQYMVQVEIYLARAFSLAQADEEEDELLDFEGTVPAHFYGEMAKTELGCQVLHDKGHFVEFAEFIRLHGLEHEDAEIIDKLKSVLWAVGNIGATMRGLQFLEDQEIIPTILEITEQSQVLSVRGTCFFVLGLISATPQGAEILDDYGWEATMSPLGATTGLCVPTQLDNFLRLPHTVPLNLEEPPPSLPVLPTQAERDVMNCIYNLANTVIAHAASRTLARIKSRPETRGVFSSLRLFDRALQALASQRYRLPVRRYIFELFDIRLDAVSVAGLLEHRRTTILGSKSNGSTSGRSRTPAAAGAPRLKRGRRRSESGSEGEDDELYEESEGELEVKPLRLKPARRVVGFDGPGDEEDEEDV